MVVKSWLKSIGDGVVGLLFPDVCVLCENPIESLDDGILCPRCWRDFPLAGSGSCCLRCGLPQRLSPLSAGSPSSCPQCRDADFTLLRFVGPYRGPLRANLLLLKRRPHICRRMAAMILEAFRQENLLRAANQVIPVPLHPLREKERGFNQAKLVAKIIAREAKIPLNDRVMTRVKHTERHRAGMDAKARIQSVQAAFRVTRPERVGDHVILLVDDIFTTGATLNACSRALLDVGAKAVYGFTVARVLDQSRIETAGRPLSAG